MGSIKTSNWFVDRIKRSWRRNTFSICRSVHYPFFYTKFNCTVWFDHNSFYCRLSFHRISGQLKLVFFVGSSSMKEILCSLFFSLKLSWKQKKNSLLRMFRSQHIFELAALHGFVRSEYIRRRLDISMAELPSMWYRNK